MKKNFYKIIVLVLCLAGILTSCANVAPYKDSTSSEITDSTVSEAPTLESLPDYSGFTDTVTIATSSSRPFTPDESAAGTISSVVAERNERIADKYGFTINTDIYDEAVLLSTLTENGLADIHTADLYCFSAELTSKLMFANRLYNLLDLDGFDVEASFIDTATAKRGTLNNELYMLFDSSTIQAEQTYAVFYNSAMLSSAGLTDPAVLYMNGTWSWQTLLEYSKVVANDVLDKGSLDYGNDTFGYGSADHDIGLINTMWTSSGYNIVADSYRSPVGLVVDLVKPSSAARRLAAVFDTKARYPLSGNDAAAAFTSGRLCFFIYKLDYIQALYDSNINWRIVPVPFSESDALASYSYVDLSALCYSLPYDIGDPLYSATLINALCAASGNDVTESVINSYVSLYSPDNTVTVMIGKVVKSSYVNFDLIYSSASAEFNTSVRYCILNSIKNGDSSLSDAVLKYERNFNNYVNPRFNESDESAES